ncbi:hypothetical protein Rhopal_000763-T1 [Rhodotorula paludigena]|uniref:Small-subunit processome Utp12 domain-containing protein n=1 Tax=Rhodotorula paludigena TaxID=86838 RepID=A0AAV5GCJ4_9BASI|nr:hypothetical protein Rhopal_000763-T1 [Rhodotorula paludigena]
MGKKAPKTAPRTTAINPAAVATTLCGFSPAATGAPPAARYYAHVHCSPDAHTLRVFEVDSGKCISRWASNAHDDSADDDNEPRVKSIAWCAVPAAQAAVDGPDAAALEGKRGKKRRKSDGGASATDSPLKAGSAKPQLPQTTLALGLENGSILLWHPQGSASRTLAHPSSNSPVTALASPVSATAGADGHIWSAHQDGLVRVWDLVSGNVVGKVSGLSEELRWDDLLVRYEAPSADGGKRTVHLVLSHLSLHVYALQLGGASKKEGKVRDLKATELGRCTGHVEPCSLRWTGASSSAASTSAIADDPTSDKLTFLSYAPTDRFVQVWQLASSTPTSSPHIGLLLARLALDSGVSSATVSPLSTSLSSQTLAAIDSATGNVSLSTLPLSFAPAAGASPGKKGKKHGSGVVALETLCEITAPGQGGRSEAGVAEVAFREGEEGKALLCRGGVKPVFETAAFMEEGAWVKKLDLARSASGLLVANGGSDAAGAPKPTRYSEHTSASVAAASAAPDAAAASDDDEALANAGELDVDMAEPTLADRLKALNVSQKKERRKAAKSQQRLADGLDDDVEVASESSGSEDLEGDEFDDDEASGPAVPATTLTTTLVQALHSQDGPLLESCLAHSNVNLVRSTVKRLPSGGLVLSLLEAIVERLGKQKKGKDGLASVKRARALIGWLKETLVVHVGFLVTIPSLVTRLAALHASLTQRLALQPPLLALQGRLELVMSQIDLRQDRARQQSLRQVRAAKKPAQGRRYVEGESTDEEGLDDEDAELEDDEDLSEGDIEDVVLGGAGAEGKSDDEDDEDEDDDGFGDLEDDDVDSDLEDEEDGEGSKVPRHKRKGVESLLDLEAEDDEDFDEDDESLGEGEELSDEDDEEAGEDSEFEA